MGDLSNFFKSFFDSRSPRKSSVPFLHEAIDLKSFPIEEVEKWKSDGGFIEFSNLINKAYRDNYFNNEKQTSEQAVTILDSSHSNGWFLKCPKLTHLDFEYKYFVYVLSSKLKDHGYVIQLAESKSTATDSGVEMMTHYYLKPSLRNRILTNQKIVNQLFGNITIEYKAVNGSPISFKFLAKSYNDSNYLAPKDFSDLNDILFN